MHDTAALVQKCNKEKIKATKANKVNHKKGPITRSEMALFKGQAYGKARCV